MTLDAAHIFALIILFGFLWNLLKAWAVEKYPRVASGMDFIYK
jgi:hypothetical protein